jgi:hypothetical protein
MKKLIISITGIATFAVVLVFSASISFRGSSISNLSIANIEALSGSESGGVTLACYDTISSIGNGNQTHKTYCGDCKATLCRAWNTGSFCVAQ